MPSKDDEHDVCDGHIQLHGPKELPAEGLRVYCGDGDSRLYALWTTLAEVLAGQLPGKGFLLTDADYKPLEPHQQVTGPELVKLAGYGRDHRWQQMCHLGMSYGCWEAGTKVRTMCDRLKRASLAARQESMAATDSGNEEEDEEEEEQAEEQQEVKLQLPGLPREGLRVYCGYGGSRQHALWTTVAQYLAGEPQGAGFLLTDADYKPLEPPQSVTAPALTSLARCSGGQSWNRICMLGSSYGGSAAGTSIRTMRARLKRESLAARQESMAATDSGNEDDEEEEEEEEEVTLQVPDLPAEGLRVYCGDGDSRQHALWTTVAQYLAGEPPGAGFLLTDADYKPLEPPQPVKAAVLIKRDGCVHTQDWRVAVRLGSSYAESAAGTSIRTMRARLKRESRAARQDASDLMVPDLPAEGLRVYFGYGGSRQHALWTRAAQYLAGERPKASFLLTDADYKPLEPPQRVKAAVLMKQAGCSGGKKWSAVCMLGSRYGSNAAGTSIRTMRARFKRESLAALQESMGASDSGSEDEEEQEEEEEEEQEEEEEARLQGLPDLPREGLRVFCGDGDSRQYALWTSMAEVLAGQLPGKGFLLTDADYKPLKPHQRVRAQHLLKASGYVGTASWQCRVKLGKDFADDNAGTAVFTVIKHWKHSLELSGRPAGNSPADRPCSSMRERSCDAGSDRQEGEEQQQQDEHGGLQELPPESLRVYCGDGDSRQYALWTSAAEALAGRTVKGDFLLTDADYKPLEPPQLVWPVHLLKAAGYRDGHNWKNKVKLGKAGIAGCTAGISVAAVMTRLMRSHRVSSRLAKRPRALDDDVLEAQDASSDSQEDDEQEEEQHVAKTEEGYEVQFTARQDVKRHKVVAAHTTQPSSSSQGPRDGFDLSLLPPLPPLKYKTSKELFLQSEIQLMSGLAGLLHVLGHGDAWRQLWHRYLHHYITSSLTMRHLDKHYEALQAAVQSESVPAIKAVLREQFKLQV